MILTAMRSDQGRSNGREVSLLSVDQASSSISAFSVVLSAFRAPLSYGCLSSLLGTVCHESRDLRRWACSGELEDLQGDGLRRMPCCGVDPIDSVPGTGIPGLSLEIPSSFT